MRYLAKGIKFEEAYDGTEVQVSFLVGEHESDDRIEFELDGLTAVSTETAAQIADAITELIDGCHEDGDYAEETKDARDRLTASIKEARAKRAAHIKAVSPATPT